MSQITRHRRFKRATVLIKRTQCLGRYLRTKGCMSSYEKLRSNNSSLAKALSKQKQKGQLLFSQNVALLAEVQDLSSACNKRDNTILKILQNAKEMLKMLVTMTKFVTSTIASCQEFTPSNMNLRMSCNPLSKGESRRLSSKSPTRGIVKPMVSGHTITKPTINLSRVNMQHFNNPTTLSTIEEVSTPVILSENSNVDDDNSPASIPVQARNTGGRICRMPERLNVTSSRASDGNERRLSKRKSKYSEQLSERHSRSRSNRLSEPNNIEDTHLLGSPRVKLNDVSKLLQNCQTINIRRLGSIKDNVVNENIEMNDSTNNISNKQDKDNIISEMQLSIDFPEETDSEENSDESIRSSKKSLKNEQPKLNVQTNNRDSYNYVSIKDDPLEGPSWLFNSYQRLSPSTNSNIESNKMKNYNNKSDNAQQCTTKTSMLHTLQYNNDSDNYQEDNKESDNLYSRKSTFKCHTSEKQNILNNSQENDLGMEDDVTINNQGFVTRQRGNSTETTDDDLDEFTLMFMRRNNNVPFDINDLQLPVLEDSVVKSIVTKEPEPEITTTLQKLTQNCELPSTNNDIKDDSLIDQLTVKLPQLSNTTLDCTIPMVDISLDTHQQKKLKNTNKLLDANNSQNITSRKEKVRRQKNKSTNDKDPSTVKVVLQKLNDSDVKSQILSYEETFLQNSSSLSDSEGSIVSTNINTENNSLRRPKRQKAPKNLKEPNLSKKLRRLK
uniref:homeobox protein 4-like isoform X1 n=1 Tax=Vespula vulgaris TaxID=7454 RepID=UPI00211FECCB|nr:homeobox protein 4-like isoform X1 [Vespula vulgaris]XP_050860063.1 homeobox protein 4-like isoform X1 [Vespula vulgaris]